MFFFFFFFILSRYGLYINLRIRNIFLMHLKFISHYFTYIQTFLFKPNHFHSEYNLVLLGEYIYYIITKFIDYLNFIFLS